MRIACFIGENIEPIMVEWEKFALTIDPTMNAVERRDNARNMLKEIMEDISKPEIEHRLQVKSKGGATDDNAETEAEKHGKERKESGFEINEIIAEFRVLRTSVLNLWIRLEKFDVTADFEDLIRFNEAIDEAVAKSLKGYSDENILVTRLLETIMLASPDPIFVLDSEGSIIFANKECEKVFGITEKEIIGRHIVESSHSFSEDMNKYYQMVYDTRKTVRGELVVQISTNKLKTYEILLRPVLDDENNLEAIVSIWHDITKRKIDELKTWHDANHDPLTDLPNRRLFIDRLEQEVKHAARSTCPLALLFIDLDGFKDVNDTLGHQVGDSLLCRVAERLSFCVRNDDVVARIGGDEFSVVLANLHVGMDVSAFATKIVEMIAEPFYINGNNVLISCSIGIALYYQDTDNAVALLRRADQAMYAAKESGRNQICFLGPSQVLKVGRFGGTDEPI